MCLKVKSFCFFVFFVLFSLHSFASNFNLNPGEVSKLNKDNKVLLIDIRDVSEYSEYSIPFSMLIPKDRLKANYLSYFANFEDETFIVIHCKSGVRGAEVVNFLRSKGVNNVYNLEGGIENWKRYDFSSHQKSGFSFNIDVMRQVQIIIGSLLLILCIIGYVKRSSKLFFVISFLGLGLLYAGLTGTCGMAKLLYKMPWN